MTLELGLVAGFVLFVVALVVGGYFLARGSGEKNEQIDQLKKENDDAAKQLERRNRPLLSNAEYRERLRRAQERYARLRDRAARDRRD